MLRACGGLEPVRPGWGLEPQVARLARSNRLAVSQVHGCHELAARGVEERSLEGAPKLGDDHGGEDSQDGDHHQQLCQGEAWALFARHGVLSYLSAPSCQLVTSSPPSTPSGPRDQMS